MNAANCEEKNQSPIGNVPLGPCVSRSREHGFSVFHCDLPPAAYVQTDECLVAVQQSINALNVWCEAGTRAVTAFSKILKGTVYEQLADHLRIGMFQVQDLAAVDMAKIQKNLKVNWFQLSRFSAGPNQQADSSHDAQIIAKELGDFVEGQFQFFQNVAHHLGQLRSSASDNSTPPSTSGSYTDRSDPSTFGQNASQLPVGSRPPCIIGNKPKAVSGGSTQTGLRKQVSSFLSKIGQKPIDSSCFYVPLDMETGSSSAANVIGPRVAAQSLAGKTVGKSNGHVATQEDLDLVIRMLSQCNKVPLVSMQTIPEHSVAVQQSGSTSKGACINNLPPGVLTLGQNQTSPVSTDVITANDGDLLNLTGGGFVSNASGGFVNQQQVHKGLLDTVADQEATKTNTWPFKTHQKTLWIGGQDLRMMRDIFGANDYDVLVSDGGDRDVPPLQQHMSTWPSPAADKLWSATMNNSSNFYADGFWPMMGSYDSSGMDSRFWPSQSSTWRTTDSAMTNVSKVVESSSCSDESSSNGEQQQQWGGGGSVQIQRRRHSSGEHSQPHLQSHYENTNARNSTDGSLPVGDKFGWTGQQQMTEKMGFLDENSGHRALSMQWSDPLTNRMLSCWNSDLVPLTKVGPTPSNPCSGGYSLKPNTSGGQLDKSF